MNMNRLARLGCGVLALLSSGCATLFHSGAQTVAVNAWESEKGEAVAARVLVDAPSSSYVATTPFQVAAYPSSFRELTLRIDDPCFETLQHTVDTRVAPVYYMNIFNVFGFGVDYLTGSLFDYERRVTLPVQRRSGDESCVLRGAPLALLPAEVSLIPRRKPKWDLGFSFGSVDPGVNELNPLFSTTLDLNYFLLPQLTLGLQISGADGDVTDYSYGTPVRVSQSSTLVTARYFLRDYGGFYVGLASGYRSLEVEFQPYYYFDKFGQIAVPALPAGGAASVEFVPLLLQAGWRGTGRVSVGIDLAAPVSRLGLGNPRPIAETNNLQEIDIPEARRLAFKAYREYRQPFEVHVRAAISF